MTDPDEVSETTLAPRRRLLPVIVVGAVAIVVVAVLAFAVGRLSTLDEPTPTTTSAEAGFARDMQTHHNQGVELALLVRDRTDDEATRLLAYDIATTQAQQSGQLYGWLTQWGLPQAPGEPSMTWMTRPPLDGGETHEHSGDSAHEPGAPMPGLASSEDIARLTAATGVEAQRIFLQLMIAHHEGAIEMAEAAVDRSTNTSVVTFAKGVITSQSSEIELMQSMLDELPAA
ncbi:DUF305 domain-containing protein [Compostimonas suwonensis]|uniref:Uncharacterized protein (DUF305 family) n=1 Tax=Compostimonas suwonensis TaxID=1048394 RepID=A0A2M9BWS2_9MICO|nr:DUF305 domain-containing protein [Compostimonas suwonensis]PJJ62388.1 uncharacterized protein (DUF305 family) [Compostimonas suwonensis]